MSRHLRLLAFALLLPLAAQAAPLPDSVREQLVGRLGFDGTRLRELGNGEMRWFGLSIYQASLWSASVQFDDSVPFALSLRYSRDIPGKRLVSTSIDELKRLGVPLAAGFGEFQEHDCALWITKLALFCGDCRNFSFLFRSLHDSVVGELTVHVGVADACFDGFFHLGAVLPGQDFVPAVRCQSCDCSKDNDPFHWLEFIQ